MIDFRKRCKNKTFLLSMAAVLITATYQILGIMEIVPRVTEDDLTTLVMVTLNILTGLGVIIDPTTDGITD